MERIFQLTTSRGDRQPARYVFKLRIFFNSRPLVEIDDTAEEQFKELIIFQLTTSRGDRQQNTGNISNYGYFQLTTSRGDRRLVAYKLAYDKFFQLTTSRGDRRVTLLIR